MPRKHRIVVDFGEAEVRRKSKENVPSFFREWTSVDAELSFGPPEWKKLPRRPSAPGYPPFDIFCHWLMDFATISANQLGRNDWHNFRRMLLLHVPDCPLFCWYCFNDAWGECAHITVGEMEAVDIVQAFRAYRCQFQHRDKEQVNILRISGGEPFTQPSLIADVAREFETHLRDDGSFLWVDTNLAPFPKDSSSEIDEAIEALARLGERAAIHACLHGAAEESFLRNTHTAISSDHIRTALKQLLEKNLRVYPRINPVGLGPSDVEAVFDLLTSLPGNLPLKTYLGPIELLYDHAIDRMRVFQGQAPLLVKSARTLPRGREPKQPKLIPPNLGIFLWNKLLEQHYGVGYAKIPRHIDAQLNRLRACQAKPSIPQSAEWKELVLLTKGWEKEVYALKMLELISVPMGAIVDVEYENTWIEPTFLAHAFACQEFYKRSGTTVLLTAALPGRTPRIIPLRWGQIRGVIPTDCRSENHSMNLRVEMNDYANDFSARCLSNHDTTVFDYLAKYVGVSRLPFAGDTSYFCHYVGIELVAEPRSYLATLKDAAFKTVILDIAQTNYEKAMRDVYFRIKSIRGIDKPRPATLREGRLLVNEGESIDVVVESCNPNLGNRGYPDVSDAAITILSTEPNLVKIAPDRIQLSKYGEPSIRISFDRSGEFQGELLFQPASSGARIASLRLPFDVMIRR
jgi:organic radical activating enzyme